MQSPRGEMLNSLPLNGGEFSPQNFGFQIKLQHRQDRPDKKVIQIKRKMTTTSVLSHLLHRFRHRVWEWSRISDASHTSISDAKNELYLRIANWHIAQ